MLLLVFRRITTKKYVAHRARIKYDFNSLERTFSSSRKERSESSFENFYPQDSQLRHTVSHRSTGIDPITRDNISGRDYRDNSHERIVRSHVLELTVVFAYRISGAPYKTETVVDKYIRSFAFVHGLNLDVDWKNYRPHVTFAGIRNFCEAVSIFRVSRHDCRCVSAQLQLYENKIASATSNLLTREPS